MDELIGMLVLLGFEALLLGQSQGPACIIIIDELVEVI